MYIYFSLRYYSDVRLPLLYSYKRKPIYSPPATTTIPPSWSSLNIHLILAAKMERERAREIEIEIEIDREREREGERERALYLMVLPQSCWVRDLAWNRDIWPACLCCWDDAWTQLWRWTTAWRSVLNSRGPTVLQTCHPPARSKSHLEGDTCYSQ